MKDKCKYLNIPFPSDNKEMYRAFKAWCMMNSKVKKTILTLSPRDFKMAKDNHDKFIKGGDE